MTDLAPPRERALKAVRALVSNPDDPLAANLLNAIEMTLDEHDAATRSEAVTAAATWLDGHGWTDAARALWNIYTPALPA